MSLAIRTAGSKLLNELLKKGIIMNFIKSYTDKSLLVFILFVVSIMCSSSVFGATVTWDGLGGNDWSDDSWYNHGTGTRLAPTASDYVIMGSGDVIVDVAAVAENLQVGPGGNVGSLDVQSSLDVSGSLYLGLGVPSVPLDGTGTIDLNVDKTITASYVSIGFDTGGTGVLNISDGTFNAPGNMVVGSYNAAVGTINMTGGTITTPYLGIGNGVGSTADVDLSGGTITINDLFIGDVAGGQGTGTLTLGGTGKLVLTNVVRTPGDWKSVLDPVIGTKILNAETTIVGDTLEITAIGGITEPIQIASFDNFSADGWQDDFELGGQHDQWLFQEAPIDGPHEGTGCARMKFENWNDPEPMDSSLNKYFTPTLDLTNTGDSITFWYWPDVVGDGKVHQLIIGDSSANFARIPIPKPTIAGWQKVAVTLEDFVPDGDPVNLADIWLIQFWFTCSPGGGNSIYIDDLRAEDADEEDPVCYEPQDPAFEGVYQDADYATINVDGDPADWASLNSEIITMDLAALQPNNGDMACQYRLAWDKDYLYVLAEELPGDTEAVEADCLDGCARKMNDGVGGEDIYDSFHLLLDFNNEGGLDPEQDDLVDVSAIDMWLFLGFSSTDQTDLMLTWGNGSWGPWHIPGFVANGSVATSGTLGSRVIEARLKWQDITDTLSPVTRQPYPFCDLMSAIRPGYVFGSDPRLSDMEGVGIWVDPQTTTRGMNWIHGRGPWKYSTQFDEDAIDVQLIYSGTCAELITDGYGLAADFNGDCKVGLADFALLGLHWLQCNDPTNADCWK
jgi:hypothetical protein